MGIVNGTADTFSLSQLSVELHGEITLEIMKRKHRLCDHKDIVEAHICKLLIKLDTSIARTWHLLRVLHDLTKDTCTYTLPRRTISDSCGTQGVALLMLWGLTNGTTLYDNVSIYFILTFKTNGPIFGKSGL